MKTVKLYNTLTREIEPLIPIKPPKVTLYCCGPTVYDHQHIGNMRTYIFEDLLVRTLKRAGFKPLHVMNITDVGHLVSDADSGEDKMLVAARREKKSSLEIAKYYTDLFLDDCLKLNIQRPNVTCKATDHIHEMIELIKRLEVRGITYVSGGNVYFDVSKFPTYGKLANLDLEKLKAGARIEVDQNKRNPQDFVLWFTKSKFENQELQWDSPWGRGYPGWHIECSAMSMKYLGERFDIHCGGIDHIPVHHTNEIAQSEGATGNPWVSIWMHGEFLVINKEKMAKSQGNFLTVSALTERGYEPLSYRYLCLTAHYRKQLNFSWEAMDGAKRSLEGLRNSISSLREKASGPGTIATVYTQEFEDAIFNDLNAPNALSVIWETINDKDLSPADKLASIYSLDEVLALGLREWKEESIEIPQEVQQLLSAREEARKNRNFKLADEIRGRISDLGYVLEDSAAGPKVGKK